MAPLVRHRVEGMSQEERVVMRRNVTAQIAATGATWGCLGEELEAPAGQKAAAKMLGRARVQREAMGDLWVSVSCAAAGPFSGGV